jgi:hypothetical protein
MQALHFSVEISNKFVEKGCEHNDVIPSLTYNNGDFIFIMIINFMQNIKKVINEVIVE